MQQPPSDHVQTRIDSWIRVMLVVAAFAPFAGTLFYGYVYDDTGIILHNSVIQGWGGLLEVWKHPYWPNGAPDRAGGAYRPFLMMIFAAIWNGAHKFAIAFHLFAVAMHATATIFLWRLLRCAVGRWAAAGGALWFAVHPVHVEAVANIANSSEVLVAVWTLLLALLLLSIPPTDGDRDGRPAPSWRRAVSAAAIYAVALLTKESGAMAAALGLLAVWGWRTPDPARQVSSRTAITAWIPVLALWTAVVVAVAVVRSHVLGGIVSGSSIAAPGIAELTTGGRVQAMLSLGGVVARLLLWPTVQSPHYGPTVFASVANASVAAGITAATIAIVLAVCSWLALRSTADRRPLTAVLWSLVAFLPASNLLTPTAQVLAERTLYISSMGIAMLVAWGLDRAFAGVSIRESVVRGAPSHRVAAAVAVVVLSAASVRGFGQTHEYAGVWRNRMSLFTQMIRADSLSYRGYQLLAIENKNQNRLPESARLYARAYSLSPDDATLLTEYGEYLLETKRPIEALAVAKQLFTHEEIQTEDREVTLLLNATNGVWGVDSTLAAAQQLHAHAPSARAALFIGMAHEALRDTSAAAAAYRDGLRIAPADSSLRARAAALGGKR